MSKHRARANGPDNDWFFEKIDQFHNDDSFAHVASSRAGTLTVLICLIGSILIILSHAGVIL